MATFKIVLLDLHFGGSHKLDSKKFIRLNLEINSECYINGGNYIAWFLSNSVLIMT